MYALLVLNSLRYKTTYIVCSHDHVSAFLICSSRSAVLQQPFCYQQDISSILLTLLHIHTYMRACAPTYIHTHTWRGVGDSTITWHIYRRRSCEATAQQNPTRTFASNHPGQEKATARQVFFLVRITNQELGRYDKNLAIANKANPRRVSAPGGLGRMTLPPQRR